MSLTMLRCEDCEFFRRMPDGKPSLSCDPFSTINPSYRKRFVRWVANAKREETRHRRVREAVALLARREKLGMK